MPKKSWLLGLVLALLVAGPLGAQSFTRQDTLRGTLLPERACYDVLHYDLNLKLNLEKKAISGYNTIRFRAVEDFSVMQVDLFENMKIDRIIYNEYPLPYAREGNAVFVKFGKPLAKGNVYEVRVYYQGSPNVAVNPPWDGGFTWATDQQGKPWVGVSCEGIGASLWWPNKDHLSDEPDSMRIYCEVPAPLTCVANGNLASLRELPNGYRAFEWKVGYPINNYNVSLNIANYAHLHNTYTAADGDTLALDYYVLAYNRDKAAAHFEQVKPMLACFEKLFGKYPFWKDGYALVETPYWGMEHQSAVAYGNNYRNNKWGFDFIIVHESAHEYFGNSLSMGDNAEMWIHESFTTYAEALYLECITGSFDKSVAYLQEAHLLRIQNKDPVLGPQGVNYDRWRDSDMYFKGAWMLHTLRSVVNNDRLWLETIYEFAQKFKISILTTEAVIDFFNQKTGKNLRPIFYQYLKHTQVPKLKYYTEKKGKRIRLYYKWEANESNFTMPVKVKLSETGEYITIFPTSEWQEITERGNGVSFATQLYYFQPEESPQASQR